MARCASCNRTILFGGHRLGEYRFCSPRCLLLARPGLVPNEQGGAGDTQDAIGCLREDIMLLVDELQQQREALSEAQERVDFLERTIVQLREAARTDQASPG